MSKVFSFSVLVCGLVWGMGQSAWAQPGGGQGRGGNMFGGAGSNVMLLADERVQKDLELSDKQVEDLNLLQEEMRTAMMELFQGMGNRGGEGRDWRQTMDEMRGKAEAMMKEFEVDMNEILLPHQLKRLKQIEIQSTSRGRGVGGTLMSEQVRNELNITRDQEQKLREAAEEIEKDLQEKIAKLRRDAASKLLDQLTPEQRSKYQELVGEPIEFGNPFQNMMRMGGQGRDGREGRGGGGGDGGRGRTDF